jgi:hypothetical protein
MIMAMLQSSQYPGFNYNPTSFGGFGGAGTNIPTLPGSQVVGNNLTPPGLPVPASTGLLPSGASSAANFSVASTSSPMDFSLFTQQGQNPTSAVPSFGSQTTNTAYGSYGHPSNINHFSASSNQAGISGHPGAMQFGALNSNQNAQHSHASISSYSQQQQSTGNAYYNNNNRNQQYSFDGTTGNAPAFGGYSNTNYSAPHTSYSFDPNLMFGTNQGQSQQGVGAQQQQHFRA